MASKLKSLDGEVRLYRGKHRVKVVSKGWNVWEVEALEEFLMKGDLTTADNPKIVISHFAGKLYGMRSHKYKKVVEGAKQLLQDP